MAGRAPLRAQRRLPPKGTYCWLRGRDSVFRSRRRCFSLRMEWTAFRKSFLLSGELQKGPKEKKKIKGNFKREESCAKYTVSSHFFILPAAQLEGSLWSSLRFGSRVNYFTHCWTLGVWAEGGEKDENYVFQSFLLISAINFFSRYQRAVMPIKQNRERLEADKRFPSNAGRRGRRVACRFLIGHHLFCLQGQKDLFSAATLCDLRSLWTKREMGKNTHGIQIIQIVSCSDLQIKKQNTFIPSIASTSHWCEGLLGKGSECRQSQNNMQKFNISFVKNQTQVRLQHRR